MSEYGEVKYRLGSGDTWPIFKETVEEWEAEATFSWSDLAVSGKLFDLIRHLKHAIMMRSSTYPSTLQ